jgi:hypothetical protein
MPAASCSNPILWDLNKDNNRFSSWSSDVGWRLNTDHGLRRRGQPRSVEQHGPENLLRALAASARRGRVMPAVYQIVPGDSRNITSRRSCTRRGSIAALTLSAAEGLDLNEIPPQPGETLINP